MAFSNSFPEALTFDDVLLLPGYTDFSRAETDLKTKLTKNISLDLPLVSAPMDTVTESELAIALARAGGIGIIHRNLTIEAQAGQVAAVKTEGLLVGAAIGSNPGYEKRVEALAAAGVDVIVIDSAHGYSKYILDAIKHLKQSFAGLQVIAGNVATYDGAKALVEAGADALRVGMGPGAICSTRVISGMGVPQITAVFETARAAKPAGIPVIADGGINYAGDVVKALAAGASTVMLGSFFASTLEAPGKVVQLTPDQVPARFRSIINGKQLYDFKEYRGMGSIGAMKKGAEISSEDEFHGKSYQDQSVLVAEGVEGLVPIKGRLQEQVDQLVGGLRSGLYYIGARDIAKLWEKAQFVKITQASLTESHPHDIMITNPGKNYL